MTSTNQDEQDANNEEYAEGVQDGARGDFFSDVHHDLIDDADSIHYKGYAEGREHAREICENQGKEENRCYLTTACVMSRGLPDNCLELTTLREFRDRVLLPTSRGKKAVSEYYRLAPKIVLAVNSGDSEMAQRVWNAVYSQVRRAMSSIRTGDFEGAFKRYEQMTARLKQAHL